MSTYAISDIHGCSRTFEALLDRIGLGKGDRLYLLGDYVDRGPSSKKVIDIIRKLIKKDYRVKVLRGNHEELFLASKAGNEMRPARTWINNGGMATLKSFGLRSAVELEAKYASFIENMEWFAKWQNFYFVHAGFNLKTGKTMQDHYSMVWIRDWYDEKLFAKKFDKDVKVVHGHSPRSPEAIKRDMDRKGMKVLNIDGGCSFAGLRPGMGYLCALDVGRNKLFVEKNRESKPE